MVDFRSAKVCNTYFSSQLNSKYLQCLFKLDPPKMVKAHVMHIIINVKFYSVDMAKNLSKS